MIQYVSSNLFLRDGGGDMRHILFIQPYASQVGGVDSVLLQLIQGMDRNRYRPFVLLPSPSPYVEKYEALGAKVMFGPLAVFGKPTDPGYYFRNLFALVKSIRFIKEVVKEFRIDLIHSHKMEVIGGNIAGKWLGIPTVQTVHELPRKPLIAYKAVAWIDHLFNDKVIVLCERSKTMFRWFGKESRKLAKIYNGIAERSLDIPRASAGIREQWRLSSRDKILITVARLSPMKGLEHLIDAAALVKRTAPHLKFLIVGDVAFEQERPYKEKLVRKIGDLRLNDSVLMHGLRRDVPELLAQADVLVLPSVYDIFPTVILEAMRAGLPVVATDVGGVPEMVRPDTGILVPPRNAEALAAAILAVCAQDDSRLGRNAQALFRREFTQEQYVRNTAAIYEELLTARAKAVPSEA
jgi:glycosyltransferase involved in cell wall biosynthesis